jgi:LysR family transcriptional regulator (chromosome initiation inhibitor)
VALIARGFQFAAPIIQIEILANPVRLVNNSISGAYQRTGIFVLFEYPLLEALAAVVREGTFEAAARSLKITQSAVSQRLRLLEEKSGAVLIVRGRPCVATEFGQHLYRHVEQVQMLEFDLQKDLTSIDSPSSSTPAVIRIAVNSDSLATWFPEAIRRVGAEMNLHLDIFQDDQEHTAERLRSGEAMAAVTAEANPLHGFRRVLLGAMEYRAVATPEFIATNFRDGVTLEAVANTAHLVFDRKDTLLQQWFLNAFGQSASHFGHSVPSVSGYVACTLNGAAWGLNPYLAVKSHIENGSLIEFVPGTSVLVPLYWQSGAMGSEILKVLSSIVVEVAHKSLLPSPGP